MPVKPISYPTSEHQPLTPSDGFRLFGERHFRAISAVLLLTMAAMQFTAMQSETVANDEGYHILNGYAYLKTGRLPLTTEHPPLGEIIPALPLLLLGLELPGHVANVPSDQSEERAREQEFLFHNRIPAETILLVSRLVAIALTMLLGLLLGWWTRRHFGAVPALAAVAILAFDPNFIANGHYAMNDVPVALCFFACVISWATFLTDGKWRTAAICGVLTGIAITTKYNAVLLLPIYVLLYIVRWWQQGQTSQDGTPYSAQRLTLSLIVVVGSSLLVVYAVFGFETEPWLAPSRMLHPMTISQRLAADPESFGTAGHWLLAHPKAVVPAEFVFQRLPIPMPSLFRGLVILSQHQIVGHPSYFLGMYSARGWWYYFPVVMAVKTPTGTILLFVLAVVGAVVVLVRVPARPIVARLKKVNPDWYVLSLPPLFYFAVCLRASINIGIRHILPVYPLAFVWMSAILFSARPALPVVFRQAAAICLILTVAESLAQYPNYLGFFNSVSGGPRMGWRYVVDSNMDLGQDVKKLPKYLSDRGIDNVCLAYFGAARLEYFGIHPRPVPSSFEEAHRSGCLIIMSITQQMFDHGQKGRYRWLDQLVPTDYVGSSYRVYDLQAASPQ